MCHIEPGSMCHIKPAPWRNLFKERKVARKKKVEDFILKSEKLMKTKKLQAANPLSLTIFWAKKNSPVS